MFVDNNISGRLKDTVTDLMYRVYAWMGIGLAITAVAAYAVASSPAALSLIYGNSWVVWALMFAQLAIVLVLSFTFTRLSFPAAAILFLAYSLLTGIVFSSIFLTFSLPSIFITFLVSASMFVVMSLYGYFTRADLSTMGNILFMILIGLVIALLVNIFFKSTLLQMILSGVGVILFSLLTAYDTQRIKAIGSQMADQVGSINKVAVFGALTLYLDFINLFLFLLNFTGRKK